MTKPRNVEAAGGLGGGQSLAGWGVCRRAGTAVDGPPGDCRGLELSLQQARGCTERASGWL